MTETVQDKLKSLFQRIEAYKKRCSKTEYRLTVVAILLAAGSAVYLTKSFIDTFGWQGVMFIAIVIFGFFGLEMNKTTR